MIIHFAPDFGVTVSMPIQVLHLYPNTLLLLLLLLLLLPQHMGR
jgi:hypothetical protein